MYAPLYPYPFYLLGRSILIPLAIKAGIAILVSCVFFPKSVNASFVGRLQAVLLPLKEASTKLVDVMQESPLDDDFQFDMLRDHVTKSESGVVPLQGTSRLLSREISFSLATGEDLKGLVTYTRALLAPADGISYYFTILKGDLRGMDYARHPRASQFATPRSTRPGTPTSSQPVSRPGTPNLEGKGSDPPLVEKEAHSQRSQHDQLLSKTAEYTARHRFPSRLAQLRGDPSSPRHSGELRRRLQDVFHVQRQQRGDVDIGLWESLRYNAVEAHLHLKCHAEYSVMFMRLLADASRDLMLGQAEAYSNMAQWLTCLNHQRPRRVRDWLLFRSTKISEPLLKYSDGSPKPMQDCVKALQESIQEFTRRKSSVIEPFRASIEADVGYDETQRIPHRYLFQSLTFCYFQLLYSNKIVVLLEEFQRIENERTAWRLQLPSWPKLLRADIWNSRDSDHEDVTHDEDPHEIPGVPSSLGQARARDPDALDSDSLLQAFGRSKLNWIQAHVS